MYEISPIQSFRPENWNLDGFTVGLFASPQATASQFSPFGGRYIRVHTNDRYVNEWETKPNYLFSSVIHYDLKHMHAMIIRISEFLWPDAMIFGDYYWINITWSQTLAIRWLETHWHSSNITGMHHDDHNDEFTIGTINIASYSGGSKWKRVFGHWQTTHTLTGTSYDIDLTCINNSNI